jgi:hypothetical protein
VAFYPGYDAREGILSDDFWGPSRDDDELAGDDKADAKVMVERSGRKTFHGRGR